ncbi:TRAP transporter substrate-binding protein [sulfur-oxidizing endosymbiont of Gigantopelta aegis]|uniref:TRAP transporter substrate-binding protein n=1 Tax=sulfur-oxidizing endosymbiont of Gigantopelta aegis TaxID=2794934 RepID=UPI003CCE209B
MIKIFSVLIICSLAFSNTLMAKEIVIKFSHVTTEKTPKGKAAKYLQELVAQRLKGKVRIEVYPNSQLYNDKEVLKALLLGDVQLAAPSLSKFGKYTKKWGLFDLPFLFKDNNAVACFTGGPAGQALLNAANNKGFQGLGYWLNGMKQLSSNKPLIVPDDAKGEKFRIMSSDVLEAQFKAVNANPQKMSFSEVYNALSTGVIDGQENTWSNIRTKKFFEVQSDFTESNHGVLEYVLVTSTEFWTSLPKNIQTELAAIIKEVTLKETQWALEAAEADKEYIIASGRTKVHTLTNEQAALWATAMKPVWKKFEDNVGIDKINAVLKCNKM